MPDLDEEIKDVESIDGRFEDVGFLAMRVAEFFPGVGKNVHDGKE